MEIKAILNKPYTSFERADFVVENNAEKGYEIKETEEQLQAWGYTAEEKAEIEKQAHINELKEQLAKLDDKSARSMRAILANTATQEDRDFLAQLEVQAEALRKEIKDLSGE